jgi:hypothetical protein
MATVQEQATRWIKQALHLDAPFEAEIIALVPEIPLNWTTLPYCPACESVLCGACGHCHGLDLLPSRPECPGDNDDMGRDCVAWYQALKAVVTMQRMGEESEG